jgi:hypothetical protein
LNSNYDDDDDDEKEWKGNSIIMVSYKLKKPIKTDDGSL